jgi:hypothetical protein
MRVTPAVIRGAPAVINYANRRWRSCGPPLRWVWVDRGGRWPSLPGVRLRFVWLWRRCARPFRALGLTQWSSGVLSCKDPLAAAPKSWSGALSRLERSKLVPTGPAANNSGLRAVVRRYATSATRQPTLRRTGSTVGPVVCGAARPFRPEPYPRDLLYGIDHATTAVQFGRIADWSINGA